MYNDIFKSHSSHLKHPECMHLSENNNSRVFYEKNDNDCIEKYFLDDHIFKFECYAYNYLKTFDICVKIIHVQKNMIIYDTKNLISLFNCIQTCKPNLTLLLNELFSFVKSFEKYNFIHGNLHVHNIFLEKETFPYRFYIMDLDNAYIKRKDVEILNLLDMYNPTQPTHHESNNIDINFLISFLKKSLTKNNCNLKELLENCFKNIAGRPVFD